MLLSEAPSSTRLYDDFVAYITDVRGFSLATVRTYKYVLDYFLRAIGDTPITELTLQQVDSHIVSIITQRHLSVGSGNTVRCVLRAFFLYIDRYRGIRLKFDQSMIRQQRNPQKKFECATTEDTKRMISELHTEQDKLMAITMFSTGLRIGELVKLDVSDIREGELVVTGKGKKVRPIPIDGNLQRLLEKHIQEHRLSIGPVFRHQVTKGSLANQAYSVSGLRKRWQRQLGPKGLYMKPHALRHGIATTLLQNGMDIRTVQEFLGHSNISTTMLYTHVTNDHLKKSYAKYFPTDFTPNTLT
jgi:site-specific recombinase XerD